MSRLRCFCGWTTDEGDREARTQAFNEHFDSEQHQAARVREGLPAECEWRAEEAWRNDDPYILAAARVELFAMGEPDRELTIKEARAIVDEYRQGYKDPNQRLA